MPDEMTLEQQISQVAFEKLVIDELTDQFKRDEMAVKDRFMDSVAELDGARKASDAFGDHASLSKVRGRKGQSGIACYVGDMGKFEKWCRENAPMLVEYALKHADDVATWVVNATGEEPSGSKAEHFKTPDGKPYAKWTLKRDEMKAILKDEYGFELDAAMPKLLEGGEV